MYWDDLRIFLAVARSGTLQAAGKRLGVDPTTVSRRIARLESALGRPLFEIGPAGHTPTARGLELIDHVETMESAAIAGTDSGADVYPDATIRVSVSEGFGTWVVAPNLHEFTAANPQIAVELVASSGFLNPSRREADISVMLARPKRGPLLVRKLTDYHLGLYAAANGPKLKGIAELKSHRLVGYVTDLIYAPELNYLNEVAEDLDVSLSSTSVNAQAAIIRSGGGLGILPCFIGEADPRLTRLLPAEIDIVRSFWVVVHRDLRKSIRVQQFLGWLDRLTAREQPSIQGATAP
ncbi:MAG TPA: LysR family transcriptional regulator [Sphingomonas sp.]|nr:LysR family transcriptional regulator [Sphingomonas sp.]